MDCEPEIIKCNHCEYYEVISSISGRCLKSIIQSIDKTILLKESLKHVNIKLNPVSVEEIKSFHVQLNSKISLKETENE